MREDLPTPSSGGTAVRDVRKTKSPRHVFWAAVVSLTMTAVGSVVLSLPRAFAECGIAGGVMCLFVFAYITDVSLNVIATAAVKTNSSTYLETVSSVCGPAAEKVLKNCLTLLLFGSLVSLQIIAADLIGPVVESIMYGNKPGWWSSRCVINSGVFTLVYPLSLLNDVRSLTATGALAFVVLFAVAGALCVRYISAGAPIATDVVWVNTTSPGLIALAMPVVSLAFTCHFNVVEIGTDYLNRKEEGIKREGADGEDEDGENTSIGTNATEINSNTKSVTRIIRVTIWCLAFPFYVAFSLVGYLGFGRNVSGDLLTEWVGDREMSVLQILVALVNVMKYPLMGFALRGIVVEWVEQGWVRWWVKKRSTPGEAEVGPGETAGEVMYDPLLANDDDDETFAGSTIDDSNDTQKKNRVYASPFAVRALCLLVMHVAIAWCAVVMRELDLVLDVIGATCGVCVAFVVPGFVLLMSGGLEMSNENAPALTTHTEDVPVALTPEDTENETSIAVEGTEHQRVSRSKKALALTLIATGVITGACGIAAVAVELV